MRIGAYQYSVTGDLAQNYASIKRGIEEAEKMGVRLLVFPECAVTGYPPYCIKSSLDIDFDAADHILEMIQKFAFRSISENSISNKRI